MSLSPGSSLGPYEITEAIGAGGMGEVYRARDTRLDRSVAIKVLPAHLSTHPELKQRLEREAKTISSLNHPHICALFDVGHEGDVDFLVMELIEGETLADRLEKGPLPIEQVVRYGQQISAALDAAHKSGVVHRDLKPGNIMVTRSGVKLLDFGLAKIVEGGMDPTSGITQMATQATPSQPITQQGTILGTFQYMAPEQLEGKEADARSDIFALGAILYEMVAGKKAFEGTSQASLIAAIIERTPAPVSSIQPLSPASLERLIGACIAKDPDDRVQTAHDVLLQLRWIEEGGSEAGMAAPVALPKRRSARLPWALAVVFGVAAAALAFLTLSDNTPEPTRLVTHVRAPESANFLAYFGGHVAISPDGTRLAFVAFGDGGEPSLWVRTLDNPQPRILSGTENGYFPFWSSDSRHIAYFTSGRLRRVSADGGPPITICSTGSGRGGAWNSDGVIVFTGGSDDPISRVKAGGGEPVAITAIDTTRNEYSHRWPVFLPDENHFLYCVQSDRDNDAVYVASLDGMTPRRLMGGASNLAYAQGHILFVRDNTLVAQPFDESALEFSGDPFTVAEPIDQHRNAHADFSMSANGTLIYMEGGEDVGSELVRYNREGQVQGTIEVPFHSDDFALSPDGRSLLYMRVNSADSEVDIWRHELERGLATRLTFSGQADDPVWSPDATEIIYASGGQLYRKAASGSGEAALVYESSQDKVTHDWSRDGRSLVFSVVSASTREDMWVLDPDAPGSERALLATPYREFHGQVSPDGRWITYTSNESGRAEVYIQSFPAMSGKWQVSSDGGSMPRWNGEGSELFFVDLERKMYVAEIDGGGDALTVGQVHHLFDTHMYASPTIRTHQYVVSRDGQELIVGDRPGAADRVGAWATLVQNWLSGR